MGLMDLFRPKWKHSNSTIRLEAVNTLCDQAILADIAKNNREWWRVRIAAADKLTDRKLAELVYSELIQTLSISPKYTRPLIDKITDQSVLIEIAKSNTYWSACLAAADKLTDRALAEHIYADIIMLAKEHADQPFYPACQNDVMQRITQNTILAEFAMNSKKDHLRRSATKQLNDQEVLTRIAQNDRDGFTRLTAADKLTDRALANRVYVNAVNSGVDPSKTVGKITDQKILYNIFLTNRNDDVRKGACEKITDQALLTEIAKNCQDKWYRRIAIEKITDQAVLYDLINNEDDTWTRLSAVRRITNQEILADIVNTYKENDERIAAIQNLTEQSKLAEIAISNKNEMVRAEAVKRITDNELIAKIGKEDDNTIVRLAASEQLWDQDMVSSLLIQLFKDGGGGLSLKEIAEKLCGDQYGLWCNNCQKVVRFWQPGYNANESYSDDRCVCPECHKELKEDVGRPDLFVNNL